MAKQGAFALLGPVLMLTGCLAIVGAAVSGFGEELTRHDAPPAAVSSIVAENVP